MYGQRFVWIFGVVFVLFVAGCGDSEDGANSPPTIALETSPVEGDTVSYHVGLSWSGSDPDGRIARYEVAVDPSPAFTEGEISRGGPGISYTLLPGAGEAPDTTRVLKAGDGGEISFDWVHTEALSQTFSFSASEPESVLDTGSGRLQPTGRFLGMHAVYVRAVDNHESASLPARVAFTASTVAPSAEILSPNIGRGFLSVGLSFTIRWTGSDPDGSDPQSKPVGYLFKLLNTTDLGLSCFPSPEPTLLYSRTNENDRGWIFVGGDTTEHTFTLPPSSCFLIGVRAVDEAGAVEPFLEFGRNAFLFRTVPNSGFPSSDLVICGPAAQCFEYSPLKTMAHETEFPLQDSLRFCWSGPESTSWGIDVLDLEGEGSESGWSAWGRTSCTPTLRPLPGFHVFYVRFRDVTRRVWVASLLFRLVSLPFDREVLYVDDYPDATYPRDSEHDAFWESMFDPVNSAGRFQTGDMVRFDVFGPGDTNQLPTAPTLEELGRYKLVIWSVNGGGYNGSQALLQVTARSHIMASYLQAGGQLWLTGVYTVAGTTPSGSGVTADLNYPKLAISAGDFVYDFLKLHSGRIDNDKGRNQNNSFVRAIPADSVFTYLPHIYDGMDVAWNKFNPRQVRGRGIPFVDAVFDPIYAEQEFGFRGDIDTLYVYGAAGKLVFRQNSGYHLRVCALRWHDPDPDREHGRVQWFGFPMYYFKDAEAQDTFNKSIDWFQEESAPPPAAQRR